MSASPSQQRPSGLGELRGGEVRAEPECPCPRDHGTHSARPAWLGAGEPTCPVPQPSRTAVGTPGWLYCPANKFQNQSEARYSGSNKPRAAWDDKHGDEDENKAPYAEKPLRRGAGLLPHKPPNWDGPLWTLRLPLAATAPHPPVHFALGVLSSGSRRTGEGGQDVCAGRRRRGPRGPDLAGALLFPGTLLRRHHVQPSPRAFAMRRWGKSHLKVPFTWNVPELGDEVGSASPV